MAAVSTLLLPAHAAQLDAPNVVEIRPDLITSGQPSPKALATLSEKGIQAVIYLAPWTVGDAVPNEPELLGQQGITFVHIPVPFGAPTEAHFTQFSQVLDGLKGKRTLVHCQINLRASTMVFLYRVIVGKEPPERAYAAVARVWSPQGPWLELVKSVLLRHQVNFEAY